MGNWQRTGAGMAWANWRHKHYTDKVLVHADEDAQNAETESIYTGRCEAWRHGRLAGDGLWEWDLPLAYAMVARDCALPCLLAGGTHHRSSRPLAPLSETRRHLYHATVTTDLPTLPVRGDGGIRWPVGTFTGWWWDTELHNARDEGASVTVDQTYIYRARPFLRQWAEWVIDEVSGRAPAESEIVRAMVKHWARALIGKFATRYTPWEPWGPAIEYGVEQHPIYDVANEALGEILTVGPDSFVGWESRYSADALPAVMAFVMAECRVRLWRLMREAGLNHVAYVDTDSLIVDNIGSRRLSSLARADQAYGARVKQHFDHVKILGPRQLVVATHQRIAGIPKGAENRGDGVWVGQSWQGLRKALSDQTADRVLITTTTWRPRGRDNRRHHLPDGRTEPYTLGELPDQSAVG